MEKIVRQELGNAVRRLRTGGKMAESDVYMIEEGVKSLLHHEATTVGLWATDKPELFDDPDKVMFQITES